MTRIYSIYCYVVYLERGNSGPAIAPPRPLPRQARHISIIPYPPGGDLKRALRTQYCAESPRFWRDGMRALRAIWGYFYLFIFGTFFWIPKPKKKTSNSGAIYYLLLYGRGGPGPVSGSPRTQGSDFPRPIDIDGGRRWGGTQGPRDGWGRPFPTADRPPEGY